MLLSECACEICTFITPIGLFLYKVMPFAVRNAPATFQWLNTKAVGDFEECTVYLDDLVAFFGSMRLCYLLREFSHTIVITVYITPC